MLNMDLYKIHLELLNSLHPIIIDNILYIVNMEVNKAIRPVGCLHKKKLQHLNNSQNTKLNTECKHKFYTRVSNLSKINFDKNEMELLNKGQKYNIPQRNKGNTIIRDVGNAIHCN